MVNFFQSPQIFQQPNPEPPGFNLLRDMLMQRAFQQNANPYGFNPSYQGGGFQFNPMGGRGLMNPYTGQYGGQGGFGMPGPGGSFPGGFGTGPMQGAGGFGGGGGGGLQGILAALMRGQGVSAPTPMQGGIPFRGGQQQPGIEVGRMNPGVMASGGGGQGGTVGQIGRSLYDAAPIGNPSVYGPPPPQWNVGAYGPPGVGGAPPQPGPRALPMPDGGPHMGAPGMPGGPMMGAPRMGPMMGGPRQVAPRMGGGGGMAHPQLGGPAAPMQPVQPMQPQSPKRPPAPSPRGMAGGYDGDQAPKQESPSVPLEALYALRDMFVGLTPGSAMTNLPAQDRINHLRAMHGLGPTPAHWGDVPEPNETADKIEGYAGAPFAVRQPPSFGRFMPAHSFAPRRVGLGLTRGAF